MRDERMTMDSFAWVKTAELTDRLETMKSETRGEKK
jgi:hypothetical protein